MQYLLYVYELKMENGNKKHIVFFAFFVLQTIFKIEKMYKFNLTIKMCSFNFG